MGDRWKRRENNFPFENSGGRSVLRIQVRITQMNGYAPIRDWGSHTSGASRSKARRRRHGTHGICGGCRASFGHLVVRVLGVTPRKGMRPLDGQRRPTSSHNRRRPTGCNHRHNALDAQALLRGDVLLVSYRPLARKASLIPQADIQAPFER